MQISALPAASSVKSTDKIVVNITPEVAGSTKSATVAQVFAAGEIRRGKVNIASGQTSVSVTGLTLGATPTNPPIVSISRPAGEDVIYAVVDAASISSSGFTAQLSAPTPSANYVLSFMI